MKAQLVQLAMMVLFGMMLVYVTQALGQKVLAKVMRSVVIFLAVLQGIQAVDGFFAGLQQSPLGQFLARLDDLVSRIPFLGR